MQICAQINRNYSSDRSAESCVIFRIDILFPIYN